MPNANIRPFICDHSPSFNPSPGPRAFRQNPPRPLLPSRLALLPGEVLDPVPAAQGAGGEDQHRGRARPPLAGRQPPRAWWWVAEVSRGKRGPGCANLLPRQGGERTGTTFRQQRERAALPLFNVSRSERGCTSKAAASERTSASSKLSVKIPQSRVSLTFIT